MNEYTTIEADQVRAIVAALKPWALRPNQTSRQELKKCLVTSDGSSVTFTVDSSKHRMSATVPTARGGEFAALATLDDIRTLVGKRKGAVKLSAKDSALTLSIGSRDAKLANVIPHGDFPKARFTDDQTTPMVAHSWPAIADVLPAASSDHSRPIICGAYFTHKGDVVTTDSYRLYETQGVCDPFQPNDSPHNRDEEKGFNIWADKLGRFIKLCGDNMTPEWSVDSLNSVARVQGSHAKLSEITFTADIKIIEGHYPNYKGLIPDDIASREQTFKVTQALIDTVKESVALTKQSCAPIRIAPNSANSIELIVDVQDKFKVSDIVDSPNTLTHAVAFNAGYLSEALTLDATVYGVDSLKPWVQLDSFGEFPRKRLVMPVRVC